MFTRIIALLTIAAAITACSDDGIKKSGVIFDAGGERDASSVDAGADDATVFDMAFGDAGPTPDQGGGPVCGDGIVEGEEGCDGPPAQRCEDFGFDRGELVCTGCQLDTSNCVRVTCGNGMVDPGEECDGSPTQTCEELGFDGGSTFCSNCQNDTSGCVEAVCGDGVVEGDETCDDGLANGSYDRCNQSCDGLAAFCGDGAVNGPEECDGSRLAGATCGSLGLGTGTLSCDGFCDYDTSNCVVPPPPPEPGQIVITEIMQNPSARTDNDGEWFEVYNASNIELDLDGCTVYSSTSAGPESFAITGPLRSPPGTYVVFARSPNIGTGWNYNYAAGINLNNASDEVELRCPDPSTGIEQQIDIVAYDNGATFPDPDGASMSLDRFSVSASVNDFGANWCLASSVYATGDFGTPGAQNDVCP